MEVNSKIENLRQDVARIEALVRRLFVHIPSQRQSHRHTENSKRPKPNEGFVPSSEVLNTRLPPPGETPGLSAQSSNGGDSSDDDGESMNVRSEIISEIHNIKQKIEDLARQVRNIPSNPTSQVS